MTVLITDPPEGYLEQLGDLPREVRMATAPEKDMDVVQIFVTSMDQFVARVKLLLPYLKSSSILWVTYPKGTSGVGTDLNRDIIWRRAKELGMDAVANFAVDDVWTAMRLKTSG